MRRAEDLKVNKRPEYYKTGLPDFFDMGPCVDIDPRMASGLAALRAFSDKTDWLTTEQRTLEKTFQQTARVHPALPEVFGSIDRLPPYSNYNFNHDPDLLYGCRTLMSLTAEAYRKLTKNRWHCTSIQLACLRPGELINPHIDSYVAHTIGEKHHVPITTNSGSRNVTFNSQTWDATFHHLQPDRLYAINNMELHSAFNFAETPRVHFIFDLICVEEFERKQLEHRGKSLYQVVPPGAFQPSLEEVVKRVASSVASRYPDLTELYRSGIHDT